MDNYIPLQSTALPTELSSGDKRLKEGGKRGKKEKKGKEGKKRGEKRKKRKEERHRAPIIIFCMLHNPDNKLS